MERDALIGHGAAFLMHDRLMNCSDRHVADVCTRCHSILSPCHLTQTAATAATVFCRACDGDSIAASSDAANDGDDDVIADQQRKQRTKHGSGKHNEEIVDLKEDDNGRRHVTAAETKRNRGEKVTQIVMPYVVRYLVNQLAAMNVKVAIDTTKYTNLRPSPP